MLIAKHYLTIGSAHYAPNDEVVTPLSDEQLQRFIRLGAIALLPDAQPATPAPAVQPAPQAPAQAAAEAEAETDLPMADVPPTIDVMDGIVKAKKGKRK